MPIMLVALWWVMSASSTSTYFPPLSRIGSTFIHGWDSEQFVSEALPSIERLFAGLGIASAVGIVLGVEIGRRYYLRAAVMPFVDFLRSVPQTALIPAGIVLLGIGSAMKIAVIAFGSVWPILLGSIDGARGADSMYHDVSTVYQLRRLDRLRYVILPAASAQIAAGIRVAISIGVIMMVVSEMVASTNGIGYFILNAQQTFDILQMWSGIILLGLLGYVLNLGWICAERRMLAWHRGLHGDQYA